MRVFRRSGSALVFALSLITVACEPYSGPVLEPLPVLIPRGPVALTAAPVGNDGGFSSGLDSVAVAVRSRAAWDSLWFPQPALYPAPPVDFGTSLVLVVASGRRPGHGWTIRIDSATSDGATLTVHYGERAQCATSGMIVQPWHVRLAPRHDGAVEFVKRETEHQPC